jgi:hypothetical protein
MMGNIFNKLVDTVSFSTGGIPLKSSLVINQEGIDIIDLKSVKLIKSVRHRLNHKRQEETQFDWIEPKRIGVIVPYRNREEHLERFVPYLRDHLKEQGLSFRILIVEQLDDLPFNRGALLNMGAQLCHDDCDFFCFHDVDLLPKEVDYTPGSQPISLVSCRTNEFTSHREFLPPHFFGGVTVISKEQFYLVNGFSNRFWGWGFEDDNFLFRCLLAGLQPCRLRNSPFLEMNHNLSVEANIYGELANHEELTANQRNLRKGRQYLSKIKRGLENPWGNGIKELKISHREIAPVLGFSRVGVDCSKIES